MTNDKSVMLNLNKIVPFLLFKERKRRKEALLTGRMRFNVNTYYF